MKKKSNRTYRARMNMRGYKQIDGKPYDSVSISSPVTNDVSVRVLLILLVMAEYNAYIVDVNGAFLHGEFDNGEVLYCQILEGFRDEYDIWCWKLRKKAYGLKEAARTFWNKVLEIMKILGFTRSICEPCVYWKWTSRR